MTRNRSLIAALVAAASLAATPALAQTTPGASGAPDRNMQRRAAFDRIDANKDGFVDRGESRAAREALFDRLDANKDGRLTPDELSFARRQRGPSATTPDASVNAQRGTTVPSTAGTGTRAARLFQRLDRDGDNAVSRAEWLAADDLRFDRCDLNKDGKLAFDECRMAAARTARPSTTVQ
jgi:hypothetical protein